jgi:hypothetical protein
MHAVVMRILRRITLVSGHKAYLLVKPDRSHVLSFLFYPFISLFFLSGAYVRVYLLCIK